MRMDAAGLVGAFRRVCSSHRCDYVPRPACIAHSTAQCECVPISCGQSYHCTHHHHARDQGPLEAKRSALGHARHPHGSMTCHAPTAPYTNGLIYLRDASHHKVGAGRSDPLAYHERNARGSSQPPDALTLRRLAGPTHHHPLHCQALRQSSQRPLGYHRQLQLPARPGQVLAQQVSLPSASLVW